MPTGAAPREEPSADAILRAAAVGGVVSTGATGAAAASGPATTFGGAKAAVTGAQVAAAVAAAMANLRGARSQDADWLWLIKPMRREFEAELPDGETPLTDNNDILVRVARQEADREREFYDRMEERLRRNLPRALASAEPQVAVEAALGAEQRFLQAHEEASATRVQATFRRDQVKQLSPHGAFWRLGTLVKEHTPDCIALAAVGWWPWEVLDRLHPPMHPGCACELLTFDEAVALGLMPPILPDTSNAVERADEIVRAFGLILEAHWLQTDSPTALAEATASFVELMADLGPRPERAVAAPGTAGLVDMATDTPLEARAGATAVELREAVDTETPKQRTGVMVALYPDSDLARDLSLRNGEHPDNLHVTLGYLGKSTELTGEDAAVQAVRRWAEGCPPLEGEISGFGYFLGNADSEGGKVTYASVDLPELPHQRERLVDELGAARVPPRRDHGFTPHMTLDYASRRPPLDKPIPLTFSKVTLAWGDNQYVFPLRGQPLADQIMEGLVDYAKEELERAGLFSKDSDYEGMLGKEILKIVKLFSEGGHSGGSAAVTVAALEKLLRYQPLTPLTSDPSEWMQVQGPEVDHQVEDDGSPGYEESSVRFPEMEPLWQSRRNPAAFSKDGGKTWEVMEARETLPLTVLDLEELAYHQRFPEGTVNGGQFMPRRGGYSPRVPLSDIVRNVLAPGELQDVSGPRGFDARRYQDPRRSLITKIQALPRGATLELADGSKVVRGQHGDSSYVIRPDGQGKRYATVDKLVNEEIKDIVERHGLTWDEAAKSRAKEEFEPSPASA